MTEAALTPSAALRVVIAAWEALDATPMRTLFSDDGVYEDPLKPATLVGPDQITVDNQAAMDDLASCRITLAHVVEEGDCAFAEGRFVAETRAAGPPLDFPFALVAETAGGKLRRLAEYFDTRPLLG